jgi:hypothetical protein
MEKLEFAISFTGTIVFNRSFLFPLTNTTSA